MSKKKAPTKGPKKKPTKKDIPKKKLGSKILGNPRYSKKAK